MSILVCQTFGGGGGYGYPLRKASSQKTQNLCHPNYQATFEYAFIFFRLVGYVSSLEDLVGDVQCFTQTESLGEEWNIFSGHSLWKRTP